MPDPLENNSSHSCPLCPDHKDYDFIWSELATTYLCHGCYYEISCGLDFQDQPAKDDYNCADTIAKFLQRLGISYKELKERWEETSAAKD